MLWDVTGGPGLETMGPYMEGIWAEKKIKEDRKQDLGEHQCFRVQQRERSPIKEGIS